MGKWLEWEDHKQEMLKDPDFKREYDALCHQYEVAHQIIGLRVKLGLTQAQLAKMIGTGQSAIARLESGEYNPSLALLKRIADATGTKVKIELS